MLRVLGYSALPYMSFLLIAPLSHHCLLHLGDGGGGEVSYKSLYLGPTGKPETTAFLFCWFMPQTCSGIWRQEPLGIHLRSHKQGHSPPHISGVNQPEHNVAQKPRDTNPKDEKTSSLFCCSWDNAEQCPLPHRELLQFITHKKQLASIYCHFLKEEVPASPPPPYFYF